MENTANTPKIEIDFKILYALSIIFIVMSHCYGGGFSVFNEFFPFYSFAISPFIFSSGYFYKSKYELNVGQFILKKIKTLIIPLYLWNIFYAILTGITLKYGFFPDAVVNLKTLFISPLIDGHQYNLNLGSWFIFPLFITQILNILIRKAFSFFNIKINEIIYFLVCIFLGILGFYLSNNDYTDGIFFILDKVLFFIPFFGFGTLYRKYKHLDKLDNKWYFSIIIAITLLIYLYGTMPNPTPSRAIYGSNNPILPFIAGILGTAFWLRISKIIVPSFTNSNIIYLISDNTYSIMINHLLGFKIVCGIFAILHTYTKFCAGFNMTLFKTNWHYCYVPHQLTQFLILYLFAGIAIPIILQKCANKIKSIIPIKSRNN